MFWLFIFHIPRKQVLKCAHLVVPSSCTGWQKLKNKQKTTTKNKPKPHYWHVKACPPFDKGGGGWEMNQDIDNLNLKRISLNYQGRISENKMQMPLSLTSEHMVKPSHRVSAWHLKRMLPSGTLADSCRYHVTPAHVQQSQIRWGPTNNSRHNPQPVSFKETKWVP